MSVIEEAIVALSFGFFFILIVIPLVMVFLATVLDILWRQDIGMSKLLWLGAAVLIPIFGVLYYWLVRPKGFDIYRKDDTSARTPTLVLVSSQTPLAEAQTQLPEPERLDRAA